MLPRAYLFGYARLCIPPEGERCTCTPKGLEYNAGMTEDLLSGDVLFVVPTPLGLHVRVTRAYWELIITTKHPAMAGREHDVKETLQDPDEIWHK